MNKKVKWIGAIAGAFALTFCAGVYTDTQVTAEDTAELWQGFAITATAVRTDDPVGLRFKTDVERLTPSMKKYNPDAEYYTVLTLTTGGQEYTTTRYADVWRPDGSGWNTVLLGIPESDYATEITAQSFIKLNGKEQAFYQTEPVTISITQTAAAAMSYGATQSYITQYVEDQVSTITLDKTSVSMEEGQTTQLTATTSPVQCMAKWTSSDINIATVDSFGKIKAKSVGTATITAEVDGKTTTCSVTVSSKNPTITLSSGNISGGSSASISSGACDVSFARWGDRTITLNGSWLDGVFADERVDAISFMMNSSRATTITTTNNLLNTSLQASTDTNLYFTRAVYEGWKASGTQNFKLTSNISTFYTATVSLKDFQKIWAEEASETITRQELAQLDGLIPEYVAQNQFDFYGYGSMKSGDWKVYNPETGEITTVASPEDFMTQYRVEEYADTGLTVLMPQSTCAAFANIGWKFKGSTMEEVMDMAANAGLKMIVSDYRLYELIGTESIVGDGKQYATEAALDAKITAWMQDYVQHEAFYGVQLPDEPIYTKITAYGEVYRSIKRCFPNVFIQANLHPTGANAIPNGVMHEPSAETLAKYQALGYGEHATYFAAFDEYINEYLDATGADYIMYDNYPLTESGVYATYIGMMQVAANIAKARGVELHFVSQTMTMQKPVTATNDRILTEADLRLLNNMQLGFGIKQLAYFTYFARDDVSSERFSSDGSFINRDGEKTDLYYSMRKILAENQAFANTILSFDYQSSAIYQGTTSSFGISYTNNVAKGTFEKVQMVSLNREAALVTELYDKGHQRYMYMIQNIADTQYATTAQTVKMTFTENYEYAVVWKNGEKSVVRIENNQYVAKLGAGEAVYVIPFHPEEDGGMVLDPSEGDNGVWFPESEQGDSHWTEVRDYISDPTTADTGVWFPGSEQGDSIWDIIE